MNNTNNLNLSELRCTVCGALGIASTKKIGDLRTRMGILHSGHKLEEVPFVAVTETAQNTAAALVQARGGVFVYNSNNSS